MTAIPNTIRRGAIYWYRRSRCLPSGNRFRPTVSLRTACPQAARQRAAILTAKFEDLFMRLLGSPSRRLALDSAAIKRIFEKEFEFALDAIEDEREQASMAGYEFRDFGTYLDVHEEVYRYLADTNCSHEQVDRAVFARRAPQLDPEASELAMALLSRPTAIWHQSLEETAAALEEEQLGTDIFHMDHAMRLRFEARLAAVQEYRQRLSDPKRRLDSLRSVPPRASELQPPPLATTPAAPPPVEGELADLTAEQMATKFITANPKLTASLTGKREARWTDKTRSQFEAAMRLLQKSMGKKPFVALTNEDLLQLLEHFDGLPPNHHKSPRHGPMSLAEICSEAQVEVKRGKLKKTELGLNIPTLNRHFRFIRMAHTWCRKHLPQLKDLNWEAYSFRDSRNARDQRDAFPVGVARKLFLLPPWHGCANRRQRFKPGREIFHDSIYWVLPIIWYSGMRREEACKLQVHEIVLSPEGIWYFDVVASEAGRLKNTASRRRVPIANELLRLGFLDFVNVMRNAGERLLFPELASDTRAMGEMYYRHAWKKLLDVYDGPAQGLTTHAIRHMVADELKAAGIDHEVRADLLGHALEDETGGRYSKAARLSILKEAVDKIPVVTKTIRKEPVWRP